MKYLAGAMMMVLSSKHALSRKSLDGLILIEKRLKAYDKGYAEGMIPLTKLARQSLSNG